MLEHAPRSGFGWPHQPVGDNSRHGPVRVEEGDGATVFNRRTLSRSYRKYCRGRCALQCMITRRVAGNLVRATCFATRSHLHRNGRRVALRWKCVGAPEKESCSQQDHEGEDMFHARGFSRFAHDDNSNLRERFTLHPMALTSMPASTSLRMTLQVSIAPTRVRFRSPDASASDRAPKIYFPIISSALLWPKPHAPAVQAWIFGPLCAGNQKHRRHSVVGPPSGRALPPLVCARGASLIRTTNNKRIGRGWHWVHSWRMSGSQMPGKVSTNG